MSDDLYKDSSDSFSDDENPSATAERVDGISAKMTMSIADLLPNRKKLLKILAAGLLLVICIIVWIFMSHDEGPDPCKTMLSLPDGSSSSELQLLKCQNRSTKLVKASHGKKSKQTNGSDKQFDKDVFNNHTVFSIVIDAGSTGSRIHIYAVRKMMKKRVSL